jgi:hypothetical protein
MAALITATSDTSGQGIFTIFKFASVDTSDTFNGPSNPRAFWTTGTSDQSTQASGGVNCTESDGTYTFFPAVDNLGVTLFVVR